LHNFFKAYALGVREQRKAIIDGLGAGSTEVHNGLFDAYQSNLQKGVSQMFSDGKYFDLQQKLTLNVSKFAAAKAFQVTQLISRQRADADGVERSREEYAKRAAAVMNQYSKYQLTEYNTAIARTRSAKQWQQFDTPIRRRLYPNLQWIPSRSANKREVHIPFYNKVWSKDDPFWSENQPGSLWNCKCDWRDTDLPATGETTEMTPPKGLRGNPGVTGNVFSDDNAYLTPRAREAIENITYKDVVSGLRINVNADAREIGDNVRTGRILMDNQDVNSVLIRGHANQLNGAAKNPEYKINGLLADAKRIESWNVAAAFNSAIKQECKTVVIDLHKMQSRELNTQELAKNIVRRNANFTSIDNVIQNCFLVWKGKSIWFDRRFFNAYTEKRKMIFYRKMEKLLYGLL
jgi:hypothetical protein